MREMNRIRIGGYLITDDNTANADEFFRFIEEKGLSAVDVFNLFYDWQGAQLFDPDFFRNTLEVEYGLEPDEDQNQE